MIEIAEFRPEEIDEAIEGLDGLQSIIAPVLRSIDKDGMGEQDVQQFVRQLTLAKHALIAMGDFLEGKMKPNGPLTLEELREMDGEPVWVEFPKCPEASGWMLVDVNRHCIYNGLLGDCDFENCGKTWCAYHRKPEEKAK